MKIGAWDGPIKAKELPRASAAQSSSIHALLSITVIVRGSTAYLKMGKLILEATLTQVHIVPDPTQSMPWPGA
jgi:hypothetical protein